MAQLQDRLLDVAEFESFSILDPSKLPDQSSPDLITYGSSQPDVLASCYSHEYGADVDKERLISKWVAFKQIINCDLNAKDFVTVLSTESTMRSPYFLVSQQLPPLLKFYQFALQNVSAVSR